MKGAEMDNLWVVLRCSGKETLDHAKTLTDSGVEVFAPYRTIRVRVPRTRRYQLKDYPVLATFLFLPSEGMGKATKLLERVAKPMVIQGEQVFVKRKEIEAMREEISRRLPKTRKPRAAAPTQPRPNLVTGQLVSITLGAFAGQLAKVISIKGDDAEIEFENFFGKACFSIFLLRPYEA